jgi:chromosomal replication initiation ATPase DnaA
LSRRAPFPMPQARAIYERVADVFNLTVDKLTSDSRAREIAHARYLVMRLLRDDGASLCTIGRLMDKHHTTVLHGLSEHERLLDDDPAYALAVIAVRSGATLA